MGETRDIRIKPEDAYKFSCDVFTEIGLQPEHADIISESLVEASLRGVDSHGLIRIDAYSKNLENGGIKRSPEITVQYRSDSALYVDGDDGPGQSATAKAIDTAINAAKDTGVAVATVINSNHFGTGAYYTQRAAQHDCIGFLLGNAGPNVVPYGGVNPYFGTNPITYSIPTNSQFNITLDMATSVVAKGYIKLAKLEGQSIPNDWAIDEDGNPITDPSKFHALRPFGGHKGYGISLLVDVLSGVLTGMERSPNLESVADDYSKPQSLGHFVAVVDIESFVDVTEFKDEIDIMIDELKRQPTQDGIDEVKLPGEIEYNTRREREQKGIPLSGELYQTLSDIGNDYGVKLETI